ncbi:MAG: sulfotransferase [Candidatus Binataceae bacterium]
MNDETPNSASSIEPGRRRLTVVHIGGYIRSGSTLLGQLLGQLSETFYLGEFSYVWRENFKDNEICGCRQPFYDCAFWRGVVAEAFGGFENVDVDGMLKLQRSVERLRYLRRLPRADRVNSFGRLAHQLDQYAKTTGQLLTAIARRSASHTLVDSSKEPAFAMMVAGLPEVKFCVVHLIRDSRAVAFSNQREKANPRRTGRQSMHVMGTARTAFEWSFYNAICAAMPRLSPRPVPYIQIRYEDLVRRPAAAIFHILRSLELEVPQELSFIRDGEAVFDVNHAVNGNPVRFRSGPVSLRLDDEWRDAMKEGSQRAMTLLTWPMLRRYGYINRAPEKLAESQQ